MNVDIDDERKYFEDEKDNPDWSNSRMSHVLQLRQEALMFGRAEKVDFILFLDADNLLVNPQTIQLLISYDMTIVAPMLNSYSDGSKCFPPWNECNWDYPFSNFWPKISEDGLAPVLDEEGEEMMQNHKRGLFKVPFINPTFLIHLKSPKSESLTFQPDPQIYKGPLNDVIGFNFNARHHGIDLWVTNEFQFGIIPKPWWPTNNIEKEQRQLYRLLENHYNENGIIEVPSYLLDHLPTKEKSKLGFDEIYVINLERKIERRNRTTYILDHLGIDFTLFKGIDGKSLSPEDLVSYRHHPAWEDPYVGHRLTYGLAGSILSQIRVWEDAMKKGYEKILVLEDDAQFTDNFVKKLKESLDELQASGSTWDFLYLGRHRIDQPEGNLEGDNRPEDPVPGTRNWVKPRFSIHLPAYIINSEGMSKLLSGQPLLNMVPSDHYIPIMTDIHTNDQLKAQFHSRNLKALAHYPGLVKQYTEKLDQTYYSYSDTELGRSGEVPEQILPYNENRRKDEL